MTLPIKRKWWDMIRSGEKKEEYREINRYYAKRLATVVGLYGRTLSANKMEEQDAEIPFQGIRLRAGYRLDSPTMQVDGRIRVGMGKPEWGAVPGIKYFIIAIDNIEILCSDDWKRTHGDSGNA